MDIILIIIGSIIIREIAVKDDDERVMLFIPPYIANLYIVCVNSEYKIRIGSFILYTCICIILYLAIYFKDSERE